MAKERARYFKTPNVIVPFGCDFNFQNALMKYKNMDKLIDYINQHSTELGITAQYSTLSDYFEAVHSTQTTWSRHSFDFFPYIDNSMRYATPTSWEWARFIDSYSSFVATGAVTLHLVQT